MGTYAEVNGTRTWYTEAGSGEPVLLLHGGLSDGRDFAGNLAGLRDRFAVTIPDRRGHGRTADVEGDLGVETMVADAASLIQEKFDGPVTVVGYSAGAMVALRLAVRHPPLVDKLVLISGAYDPEGVLLKPTLDGPIPQPLAQAYGEVSPDGIDHFPIIMEKVVTSAETDTPLTETEVASVNCPTLVMAGDDDLVTLEHTVDLFRALPTSQLAIVSGTSHILLHEKPIQCTNIVRDFLFSPVPQTFLPIRRAAALEGGSVQ